MNSADIAIPKSQAVPKDNADLGGIMSANLQRRNNKKLGGPLEGIPLPLITLHTNRQEHLLGKSVENLRENPG